jgi:hypothetical protein
MRSLSHRYDWVFGRAFVVGRDLQKAVGWEEVKKLADFFDDHGQPDVRGWLSTRSAALRALGEPEAGWV